VKAQTDCLNSTATRRLATSSSTIRRPGAVGGSRLFSRWSTTTTVFTLAWPARAGLSRKLRLANRSRARLARRQRADPNVGAVAATQGAAERPTLSGWSRGCQCHRVAHRQEPLILARAAHRTLRVSNPQRCVSGQALHGGYSHAGPPIEQQLRRCSAGIIRSGGRDAKW
jgi:hypothetical protein